MEENKDFLQGYEVKNWDFTNRIYKIIASAAIFNLLFLVVIGQTDLLQTKACNAPLINKVCSVLDTVYVGSKFLGEEWDVREYNKTEIMDADKVVWVDNTGVTPQIQYPAGYFQVANRDELAMVESLDSQFGDTTLPPFNNSPLPPMNSPPPPPPPLPPISRRNNSVFNKKPKLPKKNNNVVDGDLPDSPFGDSDEKDKDVADNKKPETEEDKTEKELEDKTAKNSDPVTVVDINKKPLEDFTSDIVTRWENKEIDLTKDFAIRIDATLTDEGRFDKTKTRFTAQQGDEDIVNVAKSAIEAIGDSGFLKYLRNQEVKRIEMTLVQNKEKLSLVLISAQSTPELAKTRASGMKGVIFGGTLIAKTEDEKTLLKSAKVTSEGRNFRINVDIPKKLANEMINRNLQQELAKKKAKAKEGSGNSLKQPSSMTEGKKTNNSTRE